MPRQHRRAYRARASRLIDKSDALLERVINLRAEALRLQALAEADAKIEALVDESAKARANLYESNKRVSDAAEALAILDQWAKVAPAKADWGMGRVNG